MDELCYLTVERALSLMRAGSLSPVELVDAVIARAEYVAPLINPFAYRYYEQARESARAAERAYGAGRARALEGIPVAVKDESMIAGQVTSNGSLLWTGNVATHTSPQVQRLLDAGAIVHARSATPEFSMSSTTHSRLWGVTRNPWNPACTPGGSSGGSAAAVAAGAALFATGSDVGGSIRQPAGLCGLVGHKPSYGRVPEDVPFNLVDAISQGALTRTVRDAVLVYDVLMGAHPDDVATLREPAQLPREPVPGRRYAFGYSYDLGLGALAPDVRAAFDTALERLRAHGCRVEPVDIALDARCAQALRAVLNAELHGALDFEEAVRGREHLLCKWTRSTLARHRRATLADLAEARSYAVDLYRRLAPLVAQYDALLVPTVRRTDVAADADLEDLTELSGQPEFAHDPNMSWLLVYPFNLVNRMPVTALPVGRAANGVPVAMQVIVRTYDDARALEVAMLFEGLRGEWFTTAADRPDLA